MLLEGSTQEEKLECPVGNWISNNPINVIEPVYMFHTEDLKCVV